MVSMPTENPAIARPMDILIGFSYMYRDGVLRTSKSHWNIYSTRLERRPNGEDDNGDYN